MNRTADIPHLIRLLDDDSSIVRRRVREQLEAFGPELEFKIPPLARDLDASGREALEDMLQRLRGEWLAQIWPSWYRLKDPYAKLEKALTLISEYQNGRNCPENPGRLLDTLAEEYLNKYQTTDAVQLSRFLFEDLGISGETRDYYNPRNSDLVYVIRERKGIPISLCCLYMLTGNRLGISIQGCNFPGHFLARIDLGDRVGLVDCYNAGRIIDPGDWNEQNLRHAEAMEALLQSPLVPEVILARVLRNLIMQYERTGRPQQAEVMKNLLDHTARQLLHRPAGRKVRQRASEPAFGPGQLVIHRRYGYRGVVVDMDDSCQADALWYFSNQTQPERRQPWYHVLVDGSNQVTYAAESSLTVEAKPARVDNPLVKIFFNGFENGCYIRNDEPWISV